MKNENESTIRTEKFDGFDASNGIPLSYLEPPINKRVTTYTVKVYIDDGRIFEYEVNSPSKVREHSAAIIKDGYRHNDAVVFEHYPPHRILKVKSEGIPTNYPDRVSGT